MYQLNQPDGDMTDMVDCVMPSAVALMQPLAFSGMTQHGIIFCCFKRLAHVEGIELQYIAF